eukprot:COSAG03_NODE_18078_length_362_cov_0.973384_2_plen_67_part_01
MYSMGEAVSSAAQCRMGRCGGARARRPVPMATERGGDEERNIPSVCASLLASVGREEEARERERWAR